MCMYNAPKYPLYSICKRVSYGHIHAFCCCCCQVASVVSDSVQPIDGSPPGSPIPGILQARTLEWVAISFSNAWKRKVKVKSLSRVWLLATPGTAAHQAPPSMDFPGKSTGVGCHCLRRCSFLSYLKYKFARDRIWRWPQSFHLCVIPMIHFSYMARVKLTMMMKVPGQLTLT